MVSLDEAVIARLEKGGSRYEILVDPELVEKWKHNPDSVKISDLLAIEEIWLDAKNGDRPTSDSLENIFGTTNIDECVIKILKEGSIQLTTQQRKKIVSEKRKQIISQISSTATDPKTKLPHPITRIENALDEIRFSIDPFKSVESQIEKAVKLLRPIIPLQFITIRLAFKIPGKDFGSVSQILRESIQKEEWLSDGTWVCIVTVPGGMKNDLIGSVAKRSPDVEVKEID